MKTTESDVAALRQHADEATQLLKTMGNPIRLMILCTLAQREFAVSELNERLQLSQSTLSQHLAILRNMGLVQTRRNAQTIFYSLHSAKVKSIMECLYNIYCR